MVSGHVIKPWLNALCGFWITSLHDKVLAHLYSHESCHFKLSCLFVFQGPGSFIASPIRDSPGPMVHGPPPGPAPYDPMLPPGRLPPPIAYRPPRPGPYHLPPGPPLLQGPPLPANGHPGMPLPGPMGGEFGPPNGLAIPPRQGPGPGIDPRGPLPPQFRPPPLHHFGPMPPPQGTFNFLLYL